MQMTPRPRRSSRRSNGDDKNRESARSSVRPTKRHIQSRSARRLDQIMLSPVRHIGTGAFALRRDLEFVDPPAARAGREVTVATVGQEFPRRLGEDAEERKLGGT